MNKSEFKTAYIDSEYFAQNLSTKLLACLNSDPESQAILNTSHAKIIGSFEALLANGEDFENLLENLNRTLISELVGLFPKIFMINPSIINPYNSLITKAERTKDSILEELKSA